MKFGASLGVVKLAGSVGVVKFGGAGDVGCECGGGYVVWGW